MCCEVQQTIDQLIKFPLKTVEKTPWLMFMLLLKPLLCVVLLK